MELAIEIPNSFLLPDDAAESQTDAQRLPDAAQDEALLAAFVQGDGDAFAILYKRHSRAVFQFAFYMAGDIHHADELTQQVFVWLIEHPSSFDPSRGTLAAYLGGVARKFLRRQQRYRSRWLPLDDALDALHAISLSHRHALLADAAIDTVQLRQAIALLPVRCREAVVLCDLQEKQYAEAAIILSCSVAAIRSRLHRGRRLLAKRLNPKRNTVGGSHAL